MSHVLQKHRFYCSEYAISYHIKDTFRQLKKIDLNAGVFQSIPHKNLADKRRREESGIG